MDDSKRKRLRDDEAPEPDLVLGVDAPEDGPPPATKRRRHGSSGCEADIATTAASASKKSRGTGAISKRGKASRKTREEEVEPRASEAAHDAKEARAKGKTDQKRRGRPRRQPQLTPAPD